MDHLSELFGEMFPDSEIAKGYSCKRTKTAQLIYDVMAPSFEKQLLTDIKKTSELSGNTVFSLIIDESTDITTEKLLAVAVKFYCINNDKLKTKFLCSVRLSGETAEDIFNSLCQSLIDLNLNIKDILGFAADTTNVMFGRNNSVVSKIKNVNPNCIFVKCVCHSCALAVSYACKKLPRALDQVVKETHNYFSHSSKRQREFVEFQEFADSQLHTILRHYEIRWLSLHACVNRILEQWDALKLYFQQEHLVEHNHSASFLHESFENKQIKLYFLFLDYILPIVNKLNVVYQGNDCNVQTIYRDISDMFKSIFSCYMKASYVRATSIEDVDPNSTVNFVEINDLYLGVKVSKEITLLRNQSFNVTIIKDFLQRCQSFLIELCTQLKNRLPTNERIFFELRFMDPQIAVYENFSSLINVTERFPNIVTNDTQKQLIDEEYRQMKYDQDVQNLMCGTSTGTVNCEQFWSKVSNIVSSQKLPKYKNLTSFVKCLMCLPISNAQCERIFSQVNMIKTKYRNRFTSNHVSSILHIKQGLTDGCTKFVPTTDMIKINKFSNNDY